MTNQIEGLNLVTLSSSQVPTMNVLAAVTGINELTLIDSGLPNFADEIFAFLKNHGMDPHNIRNLILTHFDTDHMGSAAEIRSRTNCKVIAFGFDAEVISGNKFEKRELMKMFPEYTDRQIKKLDEKIGESVAPRVRVDQVIKGEKQFSVNEEITILHTPGHTPGHISVLLRKYRALVTGDGLTVSNGKVGSPTPEYTVSLEEGVKSLKLLASLDFDLLIPYHSPPILHGGNLELKRYVGTTR